MDKGQAKTLIRRLANLGCIGFSKHCSERMGERGVTADDFLHVLMWGEVVSAEHNADTGHWRCKVNGVDVDAENLTIQVAIDLDRQMLICITVYS